MVEEISTLRDLEKPDIFPTLIKSLKSQKYSQNPDNPDFSRHSLKFRHLYKHTNPVLDDPRIQKLYIV